MLDDLKSMLHSIPQPQIRSPLSQWEESKLRAVLQELQQERQVEELFLQEHQQAYDVGLIQILDVPVTGLDSLIETIYTLSDLRRLRNVLSWSKNLKKQIIEELKKRGKEV